MPVITVLGVGKGGPGLLRQKAVPPVTGAGAGAVFNHLYPPHTHTQRCDLSRPGVERSREGSTEAHSQALLKGLSLYYKPGKNSGIKRDAENGLQTTHSSLIRLI